MKNKNMQAKEFSQWLVDQTPVFDRLIMESIRPTDGWLYNVSDETWTPDWWNVRERVRKIVEGLGYHRSREPRTKTMGEPYVSTNDRFKMKSRFL
jgi:hypothetical protein